MTRPRTPTAEVRQPVLDALIDLQARRRRAVGELEAGRCPAGARVVARGDRLGPWMMKESWSWRHVLSTRPRTSGAELQESLPNNRALLDNGLEMISVFDCDGTDDEACRLLATETSGIYYFGYAPVQMRLVNRTRVLLHGPSFPEGPSILELTDEASVAAAYRYWDVITASMTRCEATRPSGAGLTLRQRQVLDLLRLDASDARIAGALGLSLRTVRSDVAKSISALGVRSRFAAGYAYAELLTNAER